MKYIYLTKLSKNILIFFPIIFSNSISIDNFFLTLKGFIFFCILSNIVYFINDYTDQISDKKNSLKKKNLNLSLNFFIGSHFILLILMFLSYIFGLFNFSLILYVLMFYFYNYGIKKIKFIDLIFLLFFHLLRVNYGAELNSINLSYGFIIFFSLNFLILAIFKRIIQINFNNLKMDNIIISYKKNDLTNLRYICNFSLFFSILILFIFLFLNKLVLNNSIFFDDLSFNVYLSCLIFCLYLVNIIRLYKLTIKNQIREDILEFIIKDKIFITSIIFLCLSITLVNFL